MEAIRFIYAFKMVNQFPPVPILRDYLSGSKSAAKKLGGGIQLKDWYVLLVFSFNMSSLLLRMIQLLLYSHT